MAGNSTCPSQHPPEHLSVAVHVVPNSLALNPVGRPIVPVSTACIVSWARHMPALTTLTPRDRGNKGLHLEMLSGRKTGLKAVCVQKIRPCCHASCNTVRASKARDARRNERRIHLPTGMSLVHSLSFFCHRRLTTSEMEEGADLGTMTMREIDLFENRLQLKTLQEGLKHKVASIDQTPSLVHGNEACQHAAGENEERGQGAAVLTMRVVCRRGGRRGG